MINKKRIAICLFGQTRTYQVINEVYKNLNENPHLEIDFFVSTWDDFEDKRPFDFFTTAEFITPDIIKFKNNTDRASYTIHRVNLLKTIHEVNNNFIYDYVLWTRGEIYFEKEHLLELLNKKSNNHGDYEINTHSGIEKKDGHPYLPADYYFLGTSLSFDLYATGWKSYFNGINRLSKVDSNSEVVGTHGGHNYHAYVIEENYLDLKVENLTHKFQFSKLHEREV